MNIYQSMFNFKNLHLRIIREEIFLGECCREISAKCNDSDNLSPICDSEGHTHNNICEYERMACLSRKRFQTNLTIRYWGECCVDNCQQEQSGLSLCDNAQTTHDNWCKFRYMA